MPRTCMWFKKRSDIRLIKTNRINRAFRQYISKHKGELCYDNKIPIQLIQYNKETKHSLKQQINLTINNMGSEWTILAKVVHGFLVETEKSKYYWIPVITDISTENYIQSLPNTTHQQIIDVCYKMF